MKAIQTIFAAGAFLAVAAPALAQKTDAELKRCAAEAVDRVAPDKAKITTRTYENGFPPTDNIFYLARQGDVMEEGRISIAKGKSGPSTLQIEVSVSPAQTYYSMSRSNLASSLIAADKGDINKAPRHYTDVVKAENQGHARTTFQRTGDIFTLIEDCMKGPKLG